MCANVCKRETEEVKNIQIIYFLKSIWTQHSDMGGYGLLRNQSPPPAHQQASPITPVNLVIRFDEFQIFCPSFLYAFCLLDQFFKIFCSIFL